jgi:hypothetical protein
MKFDYATPRKGGAPKKRYPDTDAYERKLKTVMARLGASNLSYNWDRVGAAFVSFNVGREFYRFDHDVNKTAGLPAENRLYYGADCFCQIVLSLQDIARMTERRIYKLQTWIEGMKALPPGLEIPDFLMRLEFTDHFPDSENEIKAHFKQLAKRVHPDAGGDPEDFKRATADEEMALQWFKSKEVSRDA